MTPTTIFTHTEPNIISVQIAPDNVGTIHVTGVWQYNRGIFYCQVLAGTKTCTTPQSVVSYIGTETYLSGPPRLLIDSAGGLHLLWITVGASHNLHYAYRPSNGTWQISNNTLGTANESSDDFDIAIDGSRTVHMVWKNDSGVFYRTKPLGGPWSSQVPVTPQSGGVIQLDLDVAPNGTAHLIWYRDGLQYTTKATGGSWSSPVRISEPLQPEQRGLAVDGTGTVHVMYRIPSLNHVSYLMKNPEDSTFRPVANWHAPGIYLWSLYLDVDASGVTHVLWREQIGTSALNNIYHTQSIVAGTSADFSLSQVVTVPSNMHKATLSFLQIRGAFGDSQLQVSVSDALTSTEVSLAKNANDQWTHVWADIGNWASQTVTVTFTWHQGAGFPFVETYLDEISLGSWLTPIVTDVSPSKVDVSAGKVITITGQNFITTPAAQAGNTALLNVQRLNDTTLRATLPTGLSPGKYDIWVINPGGQDNVLPGSLQVGKLVYLPTILKQYIP